MFNKFSFSSTLSTDQKPGKKSPTPPFTTSTLQQEASRKLGFGVTRTMSTAQKLYEAGLITYMRTDSVTLSNDAKSSIVEKIETKYGNEYVNIRNYKNKNKSAQEAHEAVRPTDINVEEITSDYDQQRLYELIWKRTISSQMSDAQIEKGRWGRSIISKGKKKVEIPKEIDPKTITLEIAQKYLNPKKKK